MGPLTIENRAGTPIQPGERRITPFVQVVKLEIPGLHGGLIWNRPHANLRCTPEALRARGIDFFEITRGGDVTYHAPGQLVGYPIFDLRQHGRDVPRFCRGVEAALIRTVETFRLAARAVPGKAGVWVGERKIASLGISLRRWVTFHGFALNVAVDLTGFQVIRPCGEDPEVMTSMEALLGRQVPMGEVRGRVVAEFARVFRFGEQPAFSR